MADESPGLAGRVSAWVSLRSPGRCSRRFGAMAMARGLRAPRGPLPAARRVCRAGRPVGGL
eukprot:7703129-Lingulodinium_polyedra.AAC.1